jgi:hypothetical protein
MARIKTYTVDTLITDNDIVIGSDSDNLSQTKNYKASDLRGYMLSGLDPETGGNLKITTLTATSEEYLSPEDYINNLDPAIDVLNYEIIFLILNGRTYIFRRNGDIFGLGERQTNLSDFTEIDITSVINANLQDLNSVLTEGNEAPDKDAKIRDLYLYDDFGSPDGYARLYSDKQSLYFINKAGESVFQLEKKSLYFQIGSYAYKITTPNITEGRTATFQDASGTIAYLSDIPDTYVIDVTSNSDEITVVNTDGEIELTYNEQKDVILNKTELIDSLTDTTYYGDGGVFSFDEITEPINALKLSFEENIVSNTPANFGYIAFHYKNGDNAIYTIPLTGHSITANELIVKLPLIDYWSIDLSYFSIHLLVGCISSDVSGRSFNGITPSSITNYYNIEGLYE